MNLKKDTKPISPNIVLVTSPIKDYSPIEVVNFNMSQLDIRVKTYFVLNTALKIMHKVTVRPTHIESIEVPL